MNKKIVVILSLFLFLNFNYARSEVSQQDVQRYSAYYSNGMQYIKNHQYNEAIVEFKKVLRFSPYDTTIQEALANAYYSRAQYYRQTTKEVKKALIDYKSAYFYSKYWRENAQNPNLTSIANSSLKEINEFERRLAIPQNAQSKLQNAKNLKAQGELAAAGYDFFNLKNSQYKETVYENLGNIFKNLNNLSSSMDYYKMAIDVNPKNPKLHFLYGVLLDEARNFDASMEQYNLALQYGDKSPELLEILENKWNQNIVNNPDNAQNYINLGAIYQKQGNLEGAKSQYLKAYQLDENDDTALYNLASLYVAQKNYQDAIGVYNKLLEKKPKNVEVLQYKAQAFKELSQFDDALKQYELILAVDSNNQNAKNEAESIIMNHFSGEKLQNYLISHAQNNPNSYEAQFNLALELHKNKNYDQAIQYYKKAQTLNPSKEETHLNLASIYLEQKDYKKATEICQKGLLVLPNSQKIAQYLTDAKNYSASSQYDNATKLFEQKQYSKALAQYLQIQNKTTEVKMAIASCYWQLNDFQNANRYYLDVLSKEPNNKDALINSAWAYYSLNDFNNAKLSANKILLTDSLNQDAKDILANIESNETANLLQSAIEKYEKADYNNSLVEVNKYLAKNPNDEYGIYYKGLNLDELAKPQEALKQYKLLISKNPNFAPAYYSIALNYDNAQKYQEAVSNYEKFSALKAKNNEKDEMTTFAQNRAKELKDYLAELNGNKK